MGPIGSGYGAFLVCNYHKRTTVNRAYTLCELERCC